jgi:hypothetical protein
VLEDQKPLMFETAFLLQLERVDNVNRILVTETPLLRLGNEWQRELRVMAEEENVVLDNKMGELRAELKELKEEARDGWMINR